LGKNNFIYRIKGLEEAEEESEAEI